MLNTHPALAAIDPDRLARPATLATPALAGGGATVPAVARAARLLDCLAATRQPLSLAALVRSLELPKSTVHGLCTTLAQAGLVERLDDGSYQLGMRVMDLAHAYMARTDVSSEFQAMLRSDSPMAEDSIVLSVLDGADIVYVGCRNGTRPFGFQFRIGMRLPANCTASGKAMMCSLPPESITELALARAFYPMTSKSITGARPLLAQLAQARLLGYAVDDEETRHGMVCIGAPVFSAASARAVAGVAISMPKSALTPQRRAEAIDSVMRLARGISDRLGANSDSTAGMARPQGRRAATPHRPNTPRRQPGQGG